MLGESHYSSVEDIGKTIPHMTQSVMRQYIDDKLPGRIRRTFDNAAWAISGCDRSQLQNSNGRGEKDVWQSMVFYNYIPVVLAEAARSQLRPTPFQYNLAVEPFEKVLSDLKPDFVIVWGATLFPNVVRNHVRNVDKDSHTSKSGNWIDRRSPVTRFIKMNHPSSGFSHKKWGEVLASAMTE